MQPVLFGEKLGVFYMIKLSAVISVHNEEDKIAKCLERLSFADEIVVVMDR